jgi:3-oxoacyl-[acyl-carrier-protein] synthase-1
VTALAGARQLLAQHAVDQVLVAAVDSLLSKRRLLTLEREGRLLTRLNQNGFLAGEAAAAVLVSRDEAEVTSNRLICAGLGTAGDESSVSNDVPLRGDGLCQAIRSALDEAGCALDHLDFRISDVSGEQYYFKEASLAVSRLLRQRREQFPLWHPADCIGEVGSAIGPFVLALARTAVHKGYAPGPDILCHFSSDGGLRGAIVLSGVAGK